ncbi:MAG: helix-turn-helix domain-containing protein [Dehalococcoidia bacterium]
MNIPVARSLDIVGDRWTLLLVRDLLLGTNRFGDLLQSLDGISPNLLSTRLKALEAEGIVDRSYYSEHPPRAEYRLTARARCWGR